MNVVVFALHGCPVAALGPYGNEWIGTPHLDRLAAEGIVFDRQIWAGFKKPHSPTPSLQRGGGVPFSPLRRGEGFHSVLVRANREANDASPEFYAGWNELFDARGEALDDVLPGVLDRLADAEKWLLWIEVDRLLPPWNVQQDVFEAYVEDLLEDALETVEPWTNPPTGWFDRDDLASWELLHRTFAAVVTVFDAELGRVFDLFRERGLDRTAAWVFTAHRGLPLGEHGIIGYHRPYLHEELAHVPLIVRLPNAVEAGRRVAALTQLGDLLATIAGWLGIEGEGVGLAPLIAGTVESIRSFAITTLELGDAIEWSIRTPEWAFLLPVRQDPDDDPREPMLFAKPEDRWEVNDLRSRELDRAEELERLLREAVKRPE